MRAEITALGTESYLYDGVGVVEADIELSAAANDADTPSVALAGDTGRLVDLTRTGKVAVLAAIVDVEELDYRVDTVISTDGGTVELTDEALQALAARVSDMANQYEVSVTPTRVEVARETGANDDGRLGRTEEKAVIESVVGDVITYDGTGYEVLYAYRVVESEMGYKMETKRVQLENQETEQTRSMSIAKVRSVAESVPAAV